MIDPARGAPIGGAPVVEPERRAASAMIGSRITIGSGSASMRGSAPAAVAGGATSSGASTSTSTRRLDFDLERDLLVERDEIVVDDRDSGQRHVAIVGDRIDGDSVTRTVLAGMAAAVVNRCGHAADVPLRPGRLGVLGLGRRLGLLLVVGDLVRNRLGDRRVCLEVDRRGHFAFVVRQVLWRSVARSVDWLVGDRFVRATRGVDWLGDRIRVRARSPSSGSSRGAGSEAGAACTDVCVGAGSSSPSRDANAPSISASSI